MLEHQQLRNAAKRATSMLVFMCLLPFCEQWHDYFLTVVTSRLRFNISVCFLRYGEPCQCTHKIYDHFLCFSHIDLKEIVRTPFTVMWFPPLQEPHHGCTICRPNKGGRCRHILFLRLWFLCFASEPHTLKLLLRNLSCFLMDVLKKIYIVSAWVTERKYTDDNTALFSLTCYGMQETMSARALAVGGGFTPSNKMTAICTPLTAWCLRDL